MPCGHDDTSADMEIGTFNWLGSDNSYWFLCPQNGNSTKYQIMKEVTVNDPAQSGCLSGIALVAIDYSGASPAAGVYLWFRRVTWTGGFGSAMQTDAWFLSPWCEDSLVCILYNKPDCFRVSFQMSGKEPQFSNGVGGKLFWLFELRKKSKADNLCWVWRPTPYLACIATPEFALA